MNLMEVTNDLRKATIKAISISSLFHQSYLSLHI